MGNMVLLQALDRLVSENPNMRALIGEIIDASPDADPDVMKMTINSIGLSGIQFTLYASHNDRALWLRSLLTNYTRAGYIGDTPLIIPGVDTVDVTNTGSYFGFNHDLYAMSPILVTDMRKVFADGLRPPDKRNSAFEPVTVKEGTYWRLREAPALHTNEALDSPAPSAGSLTR
jgi:esterase/lipase superfamily enzyme